MTDANAFRFSRIFFGLTLGILILTVMVNLVVDPLGLFGMPTWSGFNAEKTQYEKYLRLAKPHMVRMLKPRGLILGTSRAQYLDPDHPGWDAAARPTYNMAIQSSRIREVLLNLQHAQAQNRLKQVVLLLDDFMFNPRVREEAGFDEARLDRHPAQGINGAWVQDLVTALLSSDLLFDSLRTIWKQGEYDTTLFLSNGSVHPTRFQSTLDKAGGHRKLFMESVRPVAADSAKTGPDSEKPFEDLRNVLRFCRAQGIDLRLLISPIHAHRLEYMIQTGGWPNYEDWKRRLVRIVAEEAEDIPGTKPFALWDFSGFNSITTERIPGRGDAHSRMQWYWESSHFKTVTGHLMFDRVLGTRSSALAVPEDFGVQIGADSIERHLRSIRDRHAIYVASHQMDIAEIAKKARGNSPTAHSEPIGGAVK